MKRIATPFALVALVAIAAPLVLADAKTTKKTLTRLPGLLGAAASMFGGSAYNDGSTSTIAVKGNRMSDISALSGSIIDLTEQKVYSLAPKSKEYTVMTFEQMRAMMAKARADMQKQADQAKARQGTPPPQPTDKPQVEMVTDTDVKETGQHKQVAGQNTREVVITLTTHEKGKTIEQSGGSVLTFNNWLASSIPAIDEITAFTLKYAKAAYGDEFAADAQQAMQAMAMYPGLQSAMQRMQQEGKKLQGTSLSSAMTFDMVLSDAAWKQAEADSKKNQSGGGGLGGFLAGKMGAGGPSKQRTTVVTITNDYLTIERTATDADVALPAGYKEKK